MSVISFNNHYNKHVDYFFDKNLRLDPEPCFEEVFHFLANLRLDKDIVHTIIAPGVREGIVISAYHALFGHFPTILYALRRGDKYVWVTAQLQEWRDIFRKQRR